MTERTLAIAAAIAFAVPHAARAQNVTAVTFVAVDGIRYDTEHSEAFHVKGIVRDEAAPREVLFHWNPSQAPDAQRSCERFVLLAMERPGRYLLTLQYDARWRHATICSLSRAAP